MSISLVFFSKNDFDPFFVFSNYLSNFFFMKHILSVIYENTSDVTYCHSVGVSRSALLAETGISAIKLLATLSKSRLLAPSRL